MPPMFVAAAAAAAVDGNACLEQVSWHAICEVVSQAAKCSIQ
eukprot:COSAG02_NODE_1923_length_10327_cov_6.211501_10_plen_42_part_00